MAARGSYRGGFNMQSGYPSKGQYDARGYSQSSGHGTPASSFHGSPSSQSPYGASGRGWNSQPQFSPQSQYPPPYPHNNYGPPTGPQGHYHGGQGHSPPYPPNGPSSQYNSGSYRGGHRGGSGTFRGSQFSAARGGLRGGFKSTQWSPQSSNGRGQFGPSEDTEPAHGAAPESPSSHAEPAPEPGDVRMEDSENPFRPSKDLQVEDTSKEEQSTQDRMPPPSRPPPTGPQSQTPNKFSFSMKNASKPTVAAPRPEISSKFNAAPTSREPPSKPAAQKTPPTRPERDRGGFPKNAPTEPASARARPGGPGDRRPPEPARQPDRTPRTRKVKKIVRQLKEKPTLPSDMANSKSVFFRKPGNESVVGSGTYGKVFKGQNVYTKKLVALKRIRMEGERDGFPVTAVREIKLLSSLSHKNVVKLQEVMVETNECFMVFEYLSHDLTGLLNHPSYTLEPAHKKHLAQQLFEGLDYLHTRGVLHRDIKAANILVSNEGILKLADFGLARFYAKHRRLDYTNRVITIWYRSPELLLGETQYGPAVDIWSAACVLMEIFTKRAVFPGDGGEINQLQKIHAVLGTPNRKDWPGLVDMPWFVLLRPKYRKPNVFEEKYKELLTPAAFDLLTSMFRYDPAKRPTAAEVLQHPYFTTEEPAPRQAIELKDIGGEWHELESKALRREKEKREKERARAAQSQSSSKEDASENSNSRDRDRKRPNEGGDAPRETKRPHIDVNGKAGRNLELDSASGRLVLAQGQSSRRSEKKSSESDPGPRPADSKALEKG
ncbi:CTD kinase subunit alpha [Madurella mycetomatis]|uniref:cyclin-dependent kinase n=1 Tax=Madurella mycetomatis TaxID=100816 RepID=A0A175WCX2_9PEZI|nr:CTD kinase subunit alpha [Madurella mycetomatis]